MSSASPGAERAALAILLRRRRSGSEAISKTCERIVVRVACSASFAAGTGKSNKQVDAKACLWIKEVRGRGRIETKPDGGDLAVGDRGGHLSDVVQTRDEFQAMVIEEIDHRNKTVARMRDDKVEVTGHST
jgi:hypothetical protein